MAQTQLSVIVLERIMGKDKVAELIETYNKNRKTTGQRSRFDTLNIPLTDEEKTMVKDYFNSALSTKQLVEKYKARSMGAITARVNALSKRIVAQNQEKFL